MYVNKSYIREVFSFIDFLKGGMEINAFIGIDFTGMTAKFTPLVVLLAVARIV